MRAVFFLSASALAVACSGGRLADLGDAGPSDAAGAPSDAGTTQPPAMVDAAPPPPTVDSGPNCEALAAELQAARAQAMTCCPICNTPQCDVAVMDTCCPFSVTGTKPASYEALVQQYVAACHPACPATPCHVEPSHICMPANPGNPGGVGVCQ